MFKNLDEKRVEVDGVVYSLSKRSVGSVWPIPGNFRLGEFREQLRLLYSIWANASKIRFAKDLIGNREKHPEIAYHNITGNTLIRNCGIGKDCYLIVIDSPKNGENIDDLESLVEESSELDRGIRVSKDGRKRFVNRKCIKFGQLSNEEGLKWSTLLTSDPEDYEKIKYLASIKIDGFSTENLRPSLRPSIKVSAQRDVGFVALDRNLGDGTLSIWQNSDRYSQNYPVLNVH